MGLKTNVLPVITIREVYFLFIRFTFYPSNVVYRYYQTFGQLMAVCAFLILTKLCIVSSTNLSLYTVVSQKLDSYDKYDVPVTSPVCNVTNYFCRKRH